VRRSENGPVSSLAIISSTSSISGPVRLAAACIAAVVACMLAPVAASAAEHTYTLRYGPVELGGYRTAFPEPRVKTPKQSGYIVRMNARLVDRKGNPVPLGHVMLHHVLFINQGVLGAAPKQSACPERPGEPFYGTGEERQQLLLPPGYGYRVEAGDRWRMTAMFMSHRLQPTRVWLEYTVTMETAKTLTPVRPLWLRASGCDPRSTYTVDGGGAPGSTDVHSADWVMPISGRIVAAGAHLHGSSKSLVIRQPRCNYRALIDHRPRYGEPGDPVYQVRPKLHEPGPIATSYFLSPTGIPVRQGEILRVTGSYDNQIPHPAVMAITHIYVAPDESAPAGCDPLPADMRYVWTRKRGRAAVPPVQLPLTSLDANGRPLEIPQAAGPGIVAQDAATVDLSSSLFTPPNISIGLGGIVTWRSLDIDRHIVSLANGPRAVDGPFMRKGQIFAQRFTVPGTYNLFCYLHPVTMHETVVVRSEPAPPPPA
jgi:plastocyanin